MNEAQYLHVLLESRLRDARTSISSRVYSCAEGFGDAMVYNSGGC